MIKKHKDIWNLLGSDSRYFVITGGRGCFAKDTRIITDYNSKPIQDVKIGDIVLSYNESRKCNEFKQVNNVFCYDIDEEIIKITLSNDETISATKDHKFFFGGRWESLNKIVSLWHERNLEENTGVRKVRSKQYGSIENSQLERVWKNSYNEACIGREWLSENCFNKRQRRKEISKGSQNGLYGIPRSADGSNDCKPQELHKNRQQTREFGVDDANGEHNGSISLRKTRCFKRRTNRKLYFKSSSSIRDTQKIYSKNLREEETCGRIRCERKYNQRYYIASELELAQIKKVEYLKDIKKVYDISVRDNNNYYLNCGKPILVHNSGKSFEVNRFATLLTFEPYQKILFTRKTLTSAHISIIPEFKEKIELLNAESVFEINKTEITNTQTKNEILFRGLQSSSKDNTANLKSLQGISCWILDEAEELTDEEVFNRIDLSIREKRTKNRVIIILNPTTKEHWIYKRFFEQPGVNPGFNGTKGNVTYIHTDYRDNIENLSPSFLEQVEYIRINNPKKYEHVLLGGWLNKAEGVVFEDWEEGEFIDNGKGIFGQDYGFSVDPTTLVKVCIEKSLKKIYVKEYLYKAKMTTSEIAEFNKKIAGDTLIIADSAEPRLIEELKRKGNNIKGAEKGPGSVSGGIARMLDYTLVVDPESKNLKKELNNYVWHDKKSNTPIDDWNHLIDPIRYVILELTEAPNNNLRQIASLL